MAECILHGKKLDQQTVAGSPEDGPHGPLDPGNSLPHERWAGLLTPPDRYNGTAGSWFPCNCFLQPLSGTHVVSYGMVRTLEQPTERPRLWGARPVTHDKPVFSTVSSGPERNPPVLIKPQAGCTSGFSWTVTS